MWFNELLTHPHSTGSSVAPRKSKMAFHLHRDSFHWPLMSMWSSSGFPEGILQEDKSQCENAHCHLLAEFLFKSHWPKHVHMAEPRVTVEGPHKGVNPGRSVTVHLHISRLVLELQDGRKTGRHCHHKHYSVRPRRELEHGIPIVLGAWVS